MAYLFKINPTRIELNPTQLKNQPNPKIKPNLSLLPVHCSLLSHLTGYLFKSKLVENLVQNIS